MASSTILEGVRMCERENEILREKLQVHLDRWGFDRSVMKESIFKMAREHGLQSAQQTYVLAQADLLHGIQMQRSHVLQRRLDSVQDEVELMKPLVLGLKFALQQEKVDKQLSRENLKKLKSALQEKFLQESRKKFQKCQKLLESRQRGYMEAVQKMKEKYSAHAKQLNGRMHQLMSELAELKRGQEQWNLDQGKLQSLGVERHKLQTELEKVQSSLEERNRILAEKEQELQELAGHRDRLMSETENWESQKEVMQAVLKDRDKLLAEKEHWAVKEHEMQELVLERENLLLQRDEWISQEKSLQQLRTERDQLTRRLQGKESEEFFKSLKERDKFAETLDTVRAERQDEVKALIRERGFVWSQMKKMEEDYTQKLSAVSGQLVQANREISKLRDDLHQAQTASNEKMVEITILQLEAKRAQDYVRQLKESLAVSEQFRDQRKVTAICTKSKKDEEEEEKDFVDGPVKELSLQEMKLQIEILQKQLNTYKTRTQEDGGPDAPSKEGPEVLNGEDLLTSDNFVSQVDQGTRMDAEERMKSSKDVEELRRENENLRVMYGQLEVLYKEKQKSEKVARNISRKDPTSRNLKVELEAAAASSPSEEVPVHEYVVGELKRRGRSSKARVLKPKSAQKTTTEEWESPMKKAKASTTIKKTSKHPVPSSSRRKTNLEHHSDGPAKRVLRKLEGEVGSTSVQDLRTERDENGLQKRSTRKRKADTDCGESQRVPLQPVPANESCDTSPARTRQQSSRKPRVGSLDCKTTSSAKGSSSLMSNLFSAAFSIPRLNIRSSSLTKS